MKTQKRSKLSNERMLRIFDKINYVCASKQIDILAKVYQLVAPLSFIDSTNNLFKFDLFSLELNVIEKLEDLLLNNFSNSKTVNTTSTSIPNKQLNSSNSTQSTTAKSINVYTNNNKSTPPNNYSTSNLNKSNSSNNNNNKSFTNNNNNNNNNNKTKELKTTIIK